MARIAQRGFQTLGGLLLIAGTLVFSAGGRSHPPVDESLGELGSVAFYRAFAEEVARHDDWVAIHTLLLFGPVLWGLGMVALTAARWRAGEWRWSSLGLFASTIGVTFWVVAFILDGFVTPSLAETVLAGDAVLGPAYTADFALVQNVVIRAGLVSWLLIGAGWQRSGSACSPPGVGSRSLGSSRYPGWRWVYGRWWRGLRGPSSRAHSPVPCGTPRRSRRASGS